MPSPLMVVNKCSRRHYLHFYFRAKQLFTGLDTIILTLSKRAWVFVVSVQYHHFVIKAQRVSYIEAF